MEGGLGQLKDPLGDFKGLSICRRTFPSIPLPGGDNGGGGSDLLSNHNLLLSLPLKDAEMFAEQGKAILEGLRGGGRGEGDGEARARRPGLGLKRPRAEFRLRAEFGGGKVNEVAEPAELDIDKFKDPEELFLAFEKLHNAKREIVKQTGCVLHEQKYNTTWDPRPRRPGLPGRSKTREYKHLFPITSSQDSSSQENITNAIETGSRQESVEREPEEKEVTDDDMEEGQQGAAAAAENQVNKILDELLACDDEDLDGDGAMNLLRDRLQIKPVVIEKFELPKMPEVRRTDFNTSHGELRKRRTALSDVHNLLKEPRIDFKKKKSMGSLANFASPTPPRSPMASLSLLRKSIMQLDPINDPFSVAKLANSPRKTDAPVKDTGKGTDAVHVDDGSRDSTNSKTAPNQSMGDDGPSLPSVRDDDSFGDINDGNLRDGGAVMEMSSVADTETENDLQKEDTQIETPGDSEANGEHTTISSPSQTHFDPAFSEDQPDIGCSETQGAAAAESDDPDLDQLQELPPAQHNEEKTEFATTSIENPTKVKPRPQKERLKREVSGRRSLAGSGTSWQTGIRRSTRIKSRPLEFWKGERFLYGRIHESLATVIGIKKFDSPANVKRTMKVKSFVSEEFKDCVDLAALG